MDAATRGRTYDVAVVGGGVIGLACGWRAAGAGLSVVVLERDRPGAGASGVAAGMLAPVTEADFGQEELLRLNLEAAGRWPSFDAELAGRSGVESGYAHTGALVVAVDRDDAEELRRLHAFQRALDLESEWLTPSASRRLEPGLAPRIAGGIHAPQDGHVDPRALVRALAVALERDGGELRSGARATGVAVKDGAVEGVETPAGLVAAERVVIAAGCRSGAMPGVPEGTAPPVRPVKGQILRMRAPAGASPATRIVRSPRCYVVARRGGEVVVGATVEERGFDTRVTADGVYRLLEAARELLPDVGELELVEAAARLRPCTPDNCPVIGAGMPDGLVWATGHHRNGVLLAPLTADAVLRSLTAGERAPAGERFAPARFVAEPLAALAGRRS